MKNFEINNSEKKNILEQHNKFKNILKERLENTKKGLVLEQVVSTGDELIKKAQKVCSKFTSGTFVKLTNGNLAIKVTVINDNPPKYMTGDILVVKSDMTYDVYDGTSAAQKKWTKKGTYTWKCDAIYKDARQAATTASQAVTADLTAKLADLKSREGWVEYDELELPANGMSKQGADNGKYGDPKIFDLGGGKSVKLYKKPGDEGVTNTGYTKEQTDTIGKYHDKGYKLTDELTNDEKLSWRFEKISVPGLPADWGMWVEPSGIAQKADATDFEQFSTNQDIDSKTCKDKLESYYDAFTKRKVFPVSTFNSMKETVQYCVNQHHPRWGGLRPGHFRDMVTIMKGGKGGPSSYGSDAKWKLQ